MRQCAECGAVYGDDVLFCSLDESPTAPMAARPPVRPPQPGDVLGNYTLKKLLGVGGMGLVYLAEHTRLSRRVALKMLRPEFAGDATAVQRFFKEARAMSDIAHENVVEVTDFVDEGARQYFVMELLQGHSLEEVLQEGRLPPPRAVHIGAQVAAALAAAHDAGVVHRDLKPQNVFLIRRSGDDDFVKVLDFGIAKVRGLSDAEKSAAGAFVGTPAYMAPEQLSQKPVDHRVDIYAFGVLLFELSTGKRPFRGGSIGELIVQQLTWQPPRPSQEIEGATLFPEPLENLILSCLEKDPERRPKSMHEVAARLSAIAPLLDPLSTGPVPDGATGDYALPSSGGWIVVPGEKGRPDPITMADELPFVDDVVEADGAAGTATTGVGPEAATLPSDAPADVTMVSASGLASGAATTSAAAPASRDPVVPLAPAAPDAAVTVRAAPVEVTEPDAPAEEAAASFFLPDDPGDGDTPVTGAHTAPPRSRRTAVAAGVGAAVTVVLVAVTAVALARDTPAGDTPAGDAAARSATPGAATTSTPSAAHAATTGAAHATAGGTATGPAATATTGATNAAAEGAATGATGDAANATATTATRDATNAAAEATATTATTATSATNAAAAAGATNAAATATGATATTATGATTATATGATTATVGATNAAGPATAATATPAAGAMREASPPAEVALSFTSKPAGASVVLDGKVIGVTPFHARLATGRPRGVVFKLAGYAPKLVALEYKDGAVIAATLHAAPRHRAAAKPSLKDGALIDPFAD